MGFQEPEHSRCRRECGLGQPRGLVRSSQDLEGPADLDLRARAGALCGGAVPPQSDLSAVKSLLHAHQQPPRQGGNQVFGPGWCLGVSVPGLRASFSELWLLTCPPGWEGYPAWPLLGLEAEPGIRHPMPQLLRASGTYVSLPPTHPGVPRTQS